MSEQDDLDRLERQLDAAFAATRPRRGFEDELWGRLGARRRRRFAWLDGAMALGAAGAVVVVLVVGVVGVSRIPHGGFSGGASTATSGAARPDEGAGSGTPPLAPRLAGPSSASDQAALPFGRVPAPAGAGVPEAIVSGTRSALPSGSVRVVVDSGVAPAAPQSVSVYRYDVGSGPAAGAVLEPGAVPPGETVGTYPARPAAEALAEAAARASGSGSGQGELRLTAARLVYVAVVADGAGYLEPVYLYSGTLTTGGTTVPAQLLLPALPASALR